MRLIVAIGCALLLAGTSARADENPIGGFFKKLFGPSQPASSPNPPPQNSPPQESTAAAANPPAAKPHKTPQKHTGPHVAAASTRNALKPDASKAVDSKPAASEPNQAKSGAEPYVEPVE